MQLIRVSLPILFTHYLRFIDILLINHAITNSYQLQRVTIIQANFMKSFDGSPTGELKKTSTSLDPEETKHSFEK